MKLGSIEIKRHKKVKKTVVELARDYLGSQEAREVCARMARSEVKNYLSELAEKSERPYANEQAFLDQISADLTSLKGSKILHPYYHELPCPVCTKDGIHDPGLLDPKWITDKVTGS